MELVGEVVAWFSDPASWTGSNGIPTRLVEHLRLSGASMLVATLVALPIGLLIGHTGRGGLLAVGVAGIRTAAVAVVATATLAALVAGGGLGRYIADGFGLRDEARLVAGAILVALLALIVERAFTFVERRVLLPGDRRKPGVAEMARPTGGAPSTA